MGKSERNRTMYAGSIFLFYFPFPLLTFSGNYGIIINMSDKCPKKG